MTYQGLRWQQDRSRFIQAVKQNICEVYPYDPVLTYWERHHFISNPSIRGSGAMNLLYNNGKC